MVTEVLPTPPMVYGESRDFSDVYTMTRKVLSAAKAYCRCMEV